jgi:uncharacterized protein (TIGR03435 family)
MKLSTLAIFVVSFGTTGVVPSLAQQAAPRVTPRVFDVASIKLNQTGSESRRATQQPGGIFTATNVSLKLLISRAYGVGEAQIRGGPGWIETEKYDVLAKADTPLEMSREEVRPCLQVVLAERFLLTVHRETKQGSVYSLVVAKNGPKLKDSSSAGSPGISGSSGSGNASITGMRMTMARLAEYLSGQTGRPTLDNTGLKGVYDFRVEWATSDASSGPSVFTALEEQLGLRVEATKGPIETIVVDRAEKPSAN